MLWVLNAMKDVKMKIKQKLNADFCSPLKNSAGIKKNSLSRETAFC